jgi:hypothetical protein
MAQREVAQLVKSSAVQIEDSPAYQAMARFYQSWMCQLDMVTAM